jgi:cation transport ATPase
MVELREHPERTSTESPENSNASNRAAEVEQDDHKPPPEPDDHKAPPESDDHKSREDHESQDHHESRDDHEPQGDHEPQDEDSDSESSEQQQSDAPKRPRVNTVIIGGCLAGLVLVAYFVWLSIEMGGHAQTGAAPMIAVFVAAGLGLGAAALAFAIGRRG